MDAAPQFHDLLTYLGDIPNEHPARMILDSPNDSSLRFLQLVQENVCKFKSCISDGRIADVAGAERMKSKLQSATDIFSAVTEIEWAVYLSSFGAVTLEPGYPDKGPDFRCSIEGRTLYVEISSIGIDANQRLATEMFHYISGRMKPISTHYVLHFEIGGEFLPHSRELKHAVARTIRTIQNLEAHLPTEAYLYYFEDEPLVTYEDLAQQTLTGRFDHETVSRYARCVQSRFKVSFTRTEKAHCPPIIIGPGSGGPESSWRRIRSLLHDKLDQLVGGEPNVVVIDFGGTFATADAFLDALYGKEVLVYSKKPYVSIVGLDRRKDGFFTSTSRLHAVVAYSRQPNEAGGPLRLVFPTNNAGTRPPPLPRAMLTQLGTIHPDCTALAKASE